MSDDASDKTQAKSMPDEATLAAWETYLAYFDNRLHPKERYAILDPDEDERQERLASIERRTTFRKALREREYVGDYDFTRDKTLPYITPAGYTMFRTGRVLGDGSEAGDGSRVFAIQAKSLSRRWFATRLMASLMERMHDFYGKGGCRSQATFLPSYEYDLYETGNGFVLSLDGASDEFSLAPFSFGTVAETDKTGGKAVAGAMFDRFPLPIDGFREQGAFKREHVSFPSGNGWEVRAIEGTGEERSRMRDWVGTPDGALLEVSFPASKVRPRPDEGVPADSVATLHVLWDGRAGIDQQSWDAASPWAQTMGLSRNMLVAWVTVAAPDGTAVPVDEHSHVTASAIAELAIALCVEMSVSPKTTKQERRLHDACEGDSRYKVLLGSGPSHRCDGSSSAHCSIRRRSESDSPWVLWQFGERSGQRRESDRRPRLFGEKPWFWPTPVMGIRLCPWCGEKLE